MQNLARRIALVGLVAALAVIGVTEPVARADTIDDGGQAPAGARLSAAAPITPPHSGDLTPVNTPGGLGRHAQDDEPPPGPYVVDCIISGNGAGTILANTCPARVNCPIEGATAWVRASVASTPGSSVTGTAKCVSTGGATCNALVARGGPRFGVCTATAFVAAGAFVCSAAPKLVAVTDTYAVRCVLK